MDPTQLEGINLAIKPLGAGDLIDRAIRLYRKNFATFLLMAAPPVIFSTLLSLGWTILSSRLFGPELSRTSGDTFLYTVFTAFGSIGIWLVEIITTFVIMGGASRNFVRHLLFGEAITFTETYKNVGRRIFGLIVGSSLVALPMGIFGVFVFYITSMVTGLLIFLVAFVFSSIPFIAVILGIVISIAAAFGGSWVFFLVASRFAYVQQAMLVEGLGIFAAMGRSATLAGKNVTRLMALFAFSVVATLAASAILYVPLGWYAWANGIELTSSGNDLIPVWLSVCYSLIGQICFILLSPVWMIGLCLLYVDERVRAEGYDIELMAARRLGDIPSVPSDYINPLQPALGNVIVTTSPTVTAAVPATRSSGSSMLGLDQ